ncbi:NUDIX hydrolase [Clostridium magnum]|uniref:Nudix hydrolase n=1 Tax=Clostridium magnum DSM 2767 TaxID=1121326 RepID=A0A162RU18_9CLOT|nr:NUDIX domain-containing protein [Clostridium magnum]KZL90377.1 nudix hydrolase [Clostridium magnum DSM 2767]SHH83598.1 NUDIX domain-containing protein [Clostridium magnum DSM 2767]
MMELWDIYDKNRNLTGRTMERGSEFYKGDFHLVIHVCIFNSKNEMLIQQRQPWKKGWPNMWDVTVGGCAVSGETSIEAAEREMFEEIGYEIDLSDERPFFTINFEVGFDDYYLVEREIEIKDLTLQYEEVQSVKWASKDEILQLVKERKFIDYWFIEYLFDMRKHRSGYRRQ